MTSAFLLAGDCLQTLKSLPDNSIDSCVVDPPYHLTSVVKRFGKEGSAPAQFGTDGAFARAASGFMGKCYHPETDILTKDGWRSVRSVQSGDLVATLDLATESLVWQRVSETHTYDFNGCLIDISHRSGRQRVTPNHQMVIAKQRQARLEFCAADNLPHHFHMLAQTSPVAGRHDEVVISTTRIYGKDRAERRDETARFSPGPFFKFFGLWLGDGYVCARSDDHPANDFFGLQVKKPRKITAIRQALMELGIRFTETTQSTGFVSFYCYNFALLEFLRPLKGAHGKRIPSHLFDWDSSYLEHLYRGLIETDGHVLKSGQEQFSTVSRALADDVQRLCLHVGRSASINLRPAKPTVINGCLTEGSDCWVICILQPGKRLYGENSATSSNVVSEVPYVGQVHCVTVPNHHTLYTRFAGRPVWSGNSWDGGDISYRPETWFEVLRVLKPGAHILCFGGTKSFHRIAVAIEDAGFELRDTMMWLYGTGFPKSHDISKGIDNTLGAKRSKIRHAARPETSGTFSGSMDSRPWIEEARKNGFHEVDSDEPASDAAAARKGWGSALKPSFEPIIMARKPLEGTLASNTLKWGVGGLNIDGCRVGTEGGCKGATAGPSKGILGNGLNGDFSTAVPGLGRWPANTLHDGSDEVEDAFAAFGNDKGQSASPKETGRARPSKHALGDMGAPLPFEPRDPLGSASRFFYSAKATAADRAGSKHPTVKPQSLMRYLVKLVTPPGGVVLDCFAGSGSTGAAAVAEGFKTVLCEREDEYIADIQRRVPTINVLRPKLAA